MGADTTGGLAGTGAVSALGAGSVTRSGAEAGATASPVTPYVSGLPPAVGASASGAGVGGVPASGAGVDVSPGSGGRAGAAAVDGSWGARRADWLPSRLCSTLLNALLFTAMAAVPVTRTPAIVSVTIKGDFIPVTLGEPLPAWKAPWPRGRPHSSKILPRRKRLAVRGAGVNHRDGHNIPMKVLVIEDDTAVADSILDGLANASLACMVVGAGADGLAALESYAPDIVLLDLGLPDMDGTEVCRAIRHQGETPIIIVSARDSEIDRVVALEMGADDFIVKPFGMRELVARIRAVTRRTLGGVSEALEPQSPAVLRAFGPLAIDTRARRVAVDGVSLHLTPKEFELLVYLSADPGAVFRRTDILHDVWETNWYGTTKTLDAHIAAIRKKLGQPGWIESVRGVGFRFQIPAAAIEPAQ
jgi:DNA-binding response OmpR family regulator